MLRITENRSADSPSSNRAGRVLHFSTTGNARCRDCDRSRLSPHRFRHLHTSLLPGQGLPVPLISQRPRSAYSGITMTVRPMRGESQCGCS